MSTLLLFEDQPPPREVLSEMAALAALRGDVVVLCCLPLDANAYDIAYHWDKAVEMIRQAAFQRGRRVECMFRFASSRLELPQRLKRGDIDLLVAAKSLPRRLVGRFTRAKPVAGCPAWLVAGDSPRQDTSM